MADQDRSLATKHSSDAGTRRPAESWTQLLENTIQAQILPLLLTPAAAEEPARGARSCGTSISQPDVEAFVRLVLVDDQPAVGIIVQRVLAAPGGREALLRHLLTPAARHLGLLWERDLCDFMDVTLGVHRLDRLMRETEFADGEIAAMHQHQRRALLMPAPGEQHRFGIAMVAEVFRAGGWYVRTGPAAARQQLVRLVRDEWFDVAGLSVSSQRRLGGVAACVRALRQASCNNRLLILLGGHAITGHEERARFLGADMVAADAYQALEGGNAMMASLEKRNANQQFRQLNLT